MKRFLRLSAHSASDELSSGMLIRLILLSMIGLLMMSGINQISHADHGGVNPARTVDLAE